MAVYTKLNDQNIIDHLANYQIGKLINFKGIIAGIDNSNFIIETTQGKFILTIFESRINKNDLPFFIELTSHLAENGICCPKPIKNNYNKFITEIKNKSSVIVTFLSGSNLEPLNSGLYDNISPDHCFEVGKISAQMHNFVRDFKMSRKNDLGIDNFKQFYDKFSSKVENYQPNLTKKIHDLIIFVNKSWKNNLPSGVIHSDLFPDNVFFKDEINNNGNITSKISGVIDFYFAANDLFIYDIACLINAWCFDENNQFIKENFKNLISGYQSIREISNEEKDFLKIALIGASLRFLLTRLHDYFFTPKDSLVKVKDPQEYIQKLDFFYANLNKNDL